MGESGSAVSIISIFFKGFGVHGNLVIDWGSFLSIFDQDVRGACWSDLTPMPLEIEWFGFLNEDHPFGPHDLTCRILDYSNLPRNLTLRRGFVSVHTRALSKCFTLVRKKLPLPRFVSLSRIHIWQMA